MPDRDFKSEMLAKDENINLGMDLFLRSKNYYYRPLTGADATDRYTGWFNDAPLQAILGTPVRDWTNRQAAQHIARFDNRKVLHLGLFPLESELPVGFSTLSLRRNDSVLSIIVIGEEEYRNFGAAHEFCRRLQKFGFIELGLNKVVGQVHEDNKPSIALCEALGMTLEGILRAHYRERGGGHASGYFFGLLRSDWEEIMKTEDPDAYEQIQGRPVGFDQMEIFDTPN